MADLHPILSGGTFGILSGERPMFKPHVEATHENLVRGLKAMGLKFEETHGKYSSPERSIIVHNPTKQQMHTLGKVMGQESVIMSDKGQHELLYTNGPDEGKSRRTDVSKPPMEVYDTPPDDFYTHLPGHGYFRINLDWDNEPKGENGDIQTLGKAFPKDYPPDDRVALDAAMENGYQLGEHGNQKIFRQKALTGGAIDPKIAYEHKMGADKTRINDVVSNAISRNFDAYNTREKLPRLDESNIAEENYKPNHQRKDAYGPNTVAEMRVRAQRAIANHNTNVQNAVTPETPETPGRHEGDNWYPVGHSKYIKKSVNDIRNLAKAWPTKTETRQNIQNQKVLGDYAQEHGKVVASPKTPLSPKNPISRTSLAWQGVGSPAHQQMGATSYGNVSNGVSPAQDNMRAKLTRIADSNAYGQDELNAHLYGDNGDLPFSEAGGEALEEPMALGNPASTQSNEGYWSRIGQVAAFPHPVSYPWQSPEDSDNSNSYEQMMDRARKLGLVK